MLSMPRIFSRRAAMVLARASSVITMGGCAAGLLVCVVRRRRAGALPCGAPCLPSSSRAAAIPRAAFSVYRWR